MKEIKLVERYPQSRTEDIIDAYMRGWNDALDATQSGKFHIDDFPQTFDKPPKCLGCLYSDLDKVFHPCASCENFSKYVGESTDCDDNLGHDCPWK